MAHSPAPKNQATTAPQPKKKSAPSLPIILHIAIILILYSITSINTTRALSCYCNECGENVDYCNTTEHNESRCFMSLEREVVRGKFEDSPRYGCLSGSDDSISTLQCNVDTHKIEKLIHMACCSTDNCNYDLPYPKESDDPRWALTLPPPVPSDEPKEQSNIWPVVVPTVAITVIMLLICLVFYKLVAKIFKKYDENNKSHNSQDSVCSFKINFDEHLKNQFINHHQHSGSSTASTHTYSISDFIPQKSESPQEDTCASIENSSTLPDMTSGVGTRVLEPRTMARVIGSGEIVPVGRGRYGRVFRGKYHGEWVAVKAFSPIDSDSWRREEKILKLLSHDNVVRFLSSELVTVNYVTETWMILDYCPHSLHDFLDSNEVCGPQQAVKILYSIIKGLNYLHEDYSLGYKPPIAHRDIKSRNILMRTPETCCLADFGHAVVKLNENSLDFGGYKHLQVGTVRYLAPEILKPTPGMDFTQFHTFAQADLYQFGLVLWEVCHRTALDILHPSGSHRLPYDGVVPPNPDVQDMIKIVCEDNYRPPSSPYWDKQPIMKRLSALMVECWRPNPKARMETLGVKKKLMELYDQLTPQQSMFYNSNLTESFSISPNFKLDKTKSSDFTL